MSWFDIPIEADGTITPSQLRHGDLVFCARRKLGLHNLNWVAGEPWRHVGAVSVDSDGDQVIVEINGDSFKHRKFRDFFPNYDVFGAVRLDMPQMCIQEATAWMDAKVGDPHQYAFDDLILAGVIACTQRRLSAKDRPMILDTIKAALDAAKPNLTHRGTDALTCSSFVAVAYKTVSGPCSLKFALWRGEASWPPRVVSVDELFDLPASEWDQVLADRSILEAVFLAAKAERRLGESKIQRAQVEELFRLFYRSVAGVLGGDREGSPILTDGRWVTPGQIWESKSVANRWTVDAREFPRYG